MCHMDSRIGLSALVYRSIGASVSGLLCCLSWANARSLRVGEPKRKLSEESNCIVTLLTAEGFQTRVLRGVDLGLELGKSPTEVSVNFRTGKSFCCSGFPNIHRAMNCFAVFSSVSVVLVPVH
jgi:hypothetical protein